TLRGSARTLGAAPVSETGWRTLRGSAWRKRSAAEASEDRQTEPEPGEGAAEQRDRDGRPRLPEQEVRDQVHGSGHAEREEDRRRDPGVRGQPQQRLLV